MCVQISPICNSSNILTNDILMPNEIWASPWLHQQPFTVSEPAISDAHIHEVKTNFISTAIYTVCHFYCTVQPYTISIFQFRCHFPNNTNNNFTFYSQDTLGTKTSSMRTFLLQQTKWSLQCHIVFHCKLLCYVNAYNILTTLSMVVTFPFTCQE